jgi:hypothetical protein
MAYRFDRAVEVRKSEEEKRWAITALWYVE